jgi:hypothetical protein
MSGRWNPERRRFLRGVGTVLGGAALARTWTGRDFWEVPLRAASGPYDPIPDPFAAGWTAENSGCTFVLGTELQITDPTIDIGVGLNFFVAASSLFGADIILAPQVLLIGLHTGAGREHWNQRLHQRRNPFGARGTPRQRRRYAERRLADSGDSYRLHPATAASPACSPTSR